MASPDLVTSSTPTSTSIRVSPTSTNSAAPSLGAETETIRFVTTEAFWNAINSTKQDILTFQYVSPQDFNRLNQERELRRRKIRFRRYNTKERFLIVVIPGMPHEQLHLRLYDEARDEIVSMGLRDSWRSSGTTTFPQQPGPQRPGSNRGEGDSSGGPYPQPNGRNWPTLVIEAGDSSSLEKLRADMRWWFSESNHQVQIVLLAKLDRPRRRIILEKWVGTTPPPRPEPTTRSASIANILQPDCVQEITIDWIENTPAEIPTSHVVTRGDLRLEFHLLFLRPPETPREHDILITIPRLQVWASMVWEAVVRL